MKLLRIVCHNGIYEYTRMPFGSKNAPAHFKRMVDTIFLPEILEVWMVVYIDDIIHQGKSRFNCWQLTSGQANVKQDKSQAHVKRKSSKRQAHITLLSYTKSCDIHQYWFPCSFSSDSSPPDHPATIQCLVKLTQDPPVCTHPHQRGPSASLDVGGGFDFTRSSMKGLCLSWIVVLQMTLVEPAAQYRGCRCVCVMGTPRPNDVLS
ncbi:hypothetical protein O181_014157 [Austropuccinia psidii MF-1]|uniref:Reverse transcriptase domain-containing protein n=1 Tax=Austropuccinia psidii MF-1 TaxID=1389203 RepID=A0A9Q3BZN5_9BASI|nr:hypothetical protein [Austropuccinia psidii MF-1]